MRIGHTVPFLFLTGALAAQDRFAELRARFADPVPAVRLAAAKQMARHGAAALPILRKAMAQGDAQVRRAALDAAAALGEQAAPLQTEIAALLRDAEAWVRTGAAAALGKQAPLPKEVIQRLVPLAADPDMFVRQAAMQTLAVRRVSREKALLLQAAVKNLAVRESGWASKRFAIKLLQQHGKGHKAAVPALLDVLRHCPEGMWDSSEPVARFLFELDQAEEVLAIFRQRLAREGDSGGRKRTLRVLGKLGSLASPLRADVARLLETTKAGHERKAIRRALDDIPER